MSEKRSSSVGVQIDAPSARNSPIPSLLNYDIELGNLPVWVTEQMKSCLKQIYLRFLLSPFN